MRGGLKKFGPVYRRDRAMRQQRLSCLLSAAGAAAGCRSGNLLQPPSGAALDASAYDMDVKPNVDTLRDMMDLREVMSNEVRSRHGYQSGLMRDGRPMAESYGQSAMSMQMSPHQSAASLQTSMSP